MGTTVIFLPLIRSMTTVPAQPGDGPGLGLEVLGRLVGQQPGHFRGQVPEILGGHIMLPHDPQLVFDERVIDDGDRHGGLLS